MATATPSLTLRALLSRAASKAGLDRSALITAGLTPAAKALAAVTSARAGAGVTLLVVPTDKDVEQMVADARFFWSAMEGASEYASEHAVLPFPSHQVDPYRGMPPAPAVPPRSTPNATSPRWTTPTASPPLWSRNPRTPKTLSRGGGELNEHRMLRRFRLLRRRRSGLLLSTPAPIAPRPTGQQYMSF